MKAKLLSLSALLLFAPTLFTITGRSAQAAPGNFTATCTNTIIRASVLSSTCKRISGAYKRTAINVNPLIANIDGRLTWQFGNGNFIATCSNTSVRKDYALFAVCKTRNGRPVETVINLAEHIANIDGVLTAAP